MRPAPTFASGVRSALKGGTTMTKIFACLTIALALFAPDLIA